MTCSRARHRLGRLPGKNYDRVARDLRDAFLSGKVVPELFVAENLENPPQTFQDHFENKVKSYATASIVIDQLWSLLQSQDSSTALVAAKKKSKETVANEFVDVLNFMIFAMSEVNRSQKQLVDGLTSRMNSATRTHADKLAMCFFAVARDRHPDLGGVPIPSMNDLIVFFGRLAMVALTVFARDVGRKPTWSEYLKLLRHPCILRLCVEIMSEDRLDAHPLFPLLVIEGDGDLNDLGQVFDPAHFEIREEAGIQSMQITHDFMEAYCATRAARAIESQMKDCMTPRVLRCPALYTGHFRDMYMWTVDLFEQWHAAR